MICPLERVQGALMGVLLGDALGQPVETMIPEAILAATGGRGITTFHPAIQTRFEDGAELMAGDTTDDWQLTETVARALIKMGDYDQTAMAMGHILAYRKSTRGWGGTTRQAISERIRYLETSGKEGLDLTTPVEKAASGKGAGSGIAMKVAPLAVFEAIRSNGPIRYERLYQDVKQLALLTHPDPRAALTAYALAIGIAEPFLEPITGPSRVKVLENIIALVQYAEINERLASDQGVTARLVHLEKMLGNAERIAEEITPGFLCTQSVIYALGIALTYPTDFRSAVLTAVNAGGASDMTASMVGALVGANVGVSGIPEEWRDFRPFYGDALDLGQLLYEAAELASEVEIIH